MGADQVASSTQSTDARSQIKTVGVIGAGQMGNGIAHVISLAGYSVRLNDIDADRITAAMTTIEGNMRRQLARNIITEADMSAGLQRVSAAKSNEDLIGCD